MSERMLVTKLVRQADGTVDLISRGHRYKDTTLFDISDLADVGLDYAALPVGVETPCRFWAIYELSDKLNQVGNPYKDVIALEPVDQPATTSSTDTSALLRELRTIRALVEDIAVAMGVAPANYEEPPAPTDDLATHLARSYGDGASLNEANPTESTAFYAYVDRTGHMPESRQKLREWWREHGQNENGSDKPRTQRQHAT